MKSRLLRFVANCDYKLKFDGIGVDSYNFIFSIDTGALQWSIRTFVWVEKERERFIDIFYLWSFINVQ